MTHVSFEKLIDITDTPMAPPQVTSFIMEDFDGSRVQNANVNPRLSGERQTSTFEVLYDDEEIQMYKFYKEVIAMCATNITEAVNGVDTGQPERIELQTFWQERQKDYIRRKDEALRNARPPTVI